MFTILSIYRIHLKEQKTMVLTRNQITALFEDAAQMGLSNFTRVDYLQVEGIV